MTQYIFRKISSILLLLLVIIIALTFSLWMNKPEGFVTIYNPPLEDLNTLSNILEDKTPITDVPYNVSIQMKKIIFMRDIAKKYTALNDMYGSNTQSYYTELVKQINKPLDKNVQGNTFDPNAMSIQNREKASVIITSPQMAKFEKLCKLLELIGNDEKLNNVSRIYENTWIKMIHSYVIYMTPKINTIGDFTSCSQFTNCTTCTNGQIYSTTTTGQINTANTQCFWNSESKTCGNVQSYGTSTTCPATDTLTQ